MIPSKAEGLRVKQTLGSGSSGIVYLAEDDQNQVVAVKVFQTLSINRTLLQKTLARLSHGAWPEGIMPITSATLDAKPALWITPLLLDDNGQPSSLQHRLAEYPAKNSWLIVREIAHALANLHRRQVAHANLKPGNVFFSPSGSILLSDWSTGNIPGISHLDFTDAYLYQPPEQLRHPDGYHNEEAYRWDVFAFAVLSWRLLTGTFPRCNDTYLQVAPPPGEAKRDGIVADLEKMARSLETAPEITWPDEPKNQREKQYRELLTQCLSLNPLHRPSNMAEVTARLDAIDSANDSEEKHNHLLHLRRKADRRTFLTLATAAALLLAALFLASQWFHTNHLLTKEKTDRANENKDLKQTTAQALADKEKAQQTQKTQVAAAQQAQQQAEQTLQNERTIWHTHIHSARTTGDRLFHWALEKDHRSLPPLDGRTDRLKQLQTFHQDFIQNHQNTPELKDDCTRSQIQLAEIALALGDHQTALTRLTQALPSTAPLTSDPAWALRLAGHRILLALLLQEKADPQTTQAFTDAHTAIKKAATTPQIDQDRLKQYRAILTYHEAKLLTEKGQDAQALTLLTSATKDLNELVLSRPDSIILRSQLAACFLSSATILEGMEKIGDAREVRTLAINELLAQLKHKPNDFHLRSELADAYGSLAEASVLAGDAAAANTHSVAATDLLEKLIREQPDNPEIAARLSAQRCIAAGLLLDQGKTKESLALLDQGIHMLEKHSNAEQSSPLARYRLGMLYLQKGQVYAYSSDRKSEINLYEKALALFTPLADKDHGFLRSENVCRTIAYVQGYAGHASMLAKDNQKARTYFEQSLTYWDKLTQSRPDSQEYANARSWMNSRLQELK